MTKVVYLSKFSLLTTLKRKTENVCTKYSESVIRAGVVCYEEIANFGEREGNSLHVKMFS